MDEKQQYALGELIIKALAGAAAESDLARLRQAVDHDSEAMDYYMEYIGLCASLQSPGNMSFEQPEEILDPKIWELLAEHERTAEAIEIPKEEPQRELIQKVVRPKVVRRVNKFSLWTSITSIAAMVLLLLYVHFAPPPASTVATITDSVNAQWAQSEHPTEIGSQLWNNEGSRWLQKGLVKITFDYGADVIIEGPSEFQLLSSEKMLLKTGRIFANVPQQASGFIVETPASTIIDLGTEFGVKVDFDGDTDVHMVKGRASLLPGIKGSKKDGLILEAGQAKHIDARSGTCQDIVLDERAFVRKIPPPKIPSLYEQAVIKSRPLAYWRFESGDFGKVTNELNPTGLTGQMSGNLSFVAGPDLGGSEENRALKFKDSDSSVRFSNISHYGNAGYTMMAWVSLDKDQEIQNFVTSSTDQRRITHLGLSESGKFVNRPRKKFMKKATLLVSNDAAEAGRWYHVVVSYSAEGERKLYINGLEQSVLKEAPGEFDYNIQAADIYLGYSLPKHKREPVTYKGFQGVMDEFAIWNRELEAREINEIFDSATVKETRVIKEQN